MKASFCFTITVIGLLMLLGSAQAEKSGNDEPVEKLKARIQSNKQSLEKRRPVYFNSYTQGWAKRRMHVDNLEYDVRKTDSLVSPFIGIVTFEVFVEQTSFYKSKDEAESAEDFQIETYASKIQEMSRVTYAFQEAGWVIKKYEVWQKGLPNSTWEEIDPTKKPEMLPQALLLEWK